MTRWGLAQSLLALAVGLAVASDARAGFTVSLNSAAPEGSNYRFTYDASIAPSDLIKTGDYFRIYDFFGLVPGSVTTPAGWTVTTDLTNPVPPPNVVLSQGDLPTVPNLTFTYTGATPINGPATFPGFSALSTFPLLGTLKDFVGLATQSGGPTAGTSVASVGVVQVPGPTPEPTALVTGAIGLVLGAGYLLRGRARQVRRNASSQS